MWRICCLLIVTSLAGHAAQIPPFFINSVVAIGHNERQSNGAQIWVTEASGFFYGYLVQDDPDPSKRRYETYLITNRHVIANRASVWVRMNPKKATDEGQVFDTAGKDWFTHQNSDVDIAAARINWQLLLNRGIDINFMANDAHAADILKMEQIGVSAGDPVFVLGFPMNLAGEHRNYAIVRPGAVARVSDLISGAMPYFLIDSHVFPGNSGGPVTLGLSMFAIDGTKSNNMAYLIGVVSNFISYIDVAASQQTQRPRVTFEENSGLAEVIPIDRVNETIKAWRSSLPSGSPPGPLKTAPPSGRQ